MKQRECPFCAGNVSVVESYDNGSSYVVTCENCGACGPLGANAQQAREAWINREEPDTAELCGTVIHGTMRLEDLLPAFADELEDRTGEEIDVSWYVDNEDPDEADEEEAADLLAEIMDKLTEAAPEGVYFGASPGDGADYGYWRVEDYD